MTSRENGTTERAGGFLFVWDGENENGSLTGLVWRDNTEQDFTLAPEAYIRQMNGDLSDTIMIRGTEDGAEMAVSNLEAAAGWVWGYHTARWDAQREARRVEPLD